MVFLLRSLVLVLALQAQSFTHHHTFFPLRQHSPSSLVKPFRVGRVGSACHIPALRPTTTTTTTTKLRPTGSLKRACCTRLLLQFTPEAVNATSSDSDIGDDQGGDESEIELFGVGEVADTIEETDEDKSLWGNQPRKFSEFDAKCDDWFARLLYDDYDAPQGVEGDGRSFNEISVFPTEKNTLRGLRQETHKTYFPKSPSHIPPPDTSLPRGCETISPMLPILRRQTEPWRGFDVEGMVDVRYISQRLGVDGWGEPTLPDNIASSITEADIAASTFGYGSTPEDIHTRIVYVDNVFVGRLSWFGDVGRHVGDSVLKDDIHDLLGRLPDGATDTIPESEGKKISALSGPNHNVGSHTSREALNNQQGSSAFAALNSARCQHAAVVEVGDGQVISKPILIVNAMTGNNVDSTNTPMAVHPRTAIIAGPNSAASVFEIHVDLAKAKDSTTTTPNNNAPFFVNSLVQVQVGASANVTHTVISDLGGSVLSDVELPDSPTRQRDKDRVHAKSTFMKTVDVNIVGEGGRYVGSLFSSGGCGRERICISTGLLKPHAHAAINGLVIAGGHQCTDVRTNIHHVSPHTTSAQGQRNVVGGRGRVGFRGRIRVEEEAQKTDSKQLVRNLLLNDRCKVVNVPSLEVIADDVACTHGATVSDLSEEELFYLRSRGFTRDEGRRILMYAFVDEMGKNMDETFLLGKVARDGRKDGEDGRVERTGGYKERLIEQLANIVPKGDRSVKGEFQSV